MNYINIDVKTCYTKHFDSMIRIKDLVAYAKNNNQEYVVITDEEKMFAYVEFVREAQKNDLKPIVGITLNVYYETHKFKVVLYPKTKEAFQMIMKLSTKANIEGDLDIKEILPMMNSMIIVFEFMGKDRKKQMIENVIELIDRRKVEPYIAIRINKKEHRERAERLVKSAKEKKVKIVAAQNTKYWEGQEELIGIIQNIRKIDKQNKVSNSYKNLNQLKELYQGYEEALENTVQIAKKCYTDYVLRGHKDFKDMNAKFPIPKDYKVKEVKDKFQEFPNYPIDLNEEKRRLVSYFIDQIVENPEIQEDMKKIGEEKVKQRIAYEVGVIVAKNYENYFLVVKDFIDFAKGKGVHPKNEMNVVVGTGRGSSGASYVAELLNIVEGVNPIEYGFMFERFLNQNVETHDPDVDIDISKAFRSQMYKYAQSKYGRRRVAKVATFGRYAGKSNIRDLGKELEIKKEILDLLAKKINDGIKDLEFHKEEIARLIDEEPKVRKLIKMAYQIDGLPKNESIHPAGAVMAEEDIDTFLPVYESFDEETQQHVLVIQLDKEMITEVGLSKIDFLGLRNLDVMEETIKAIKGRYGIEFSLEDIPLNDPKTFELYQAGKLTGVFQMDSEGMQKTSVMAQPKTVADIFHLIAIYRPGSMKMIQKYSENIKNGTNTVWSMKELPNGKVEYQKIIQGEEILKPILDKTRGIILYQEQIMRILSSWSGFDASEADVFRRGISKKETEKIMNSKKEFIQRSQKLGRDVKVSESIFELIRKFGEYGFNEPHAGHYGLLSYRTAYLKANYPTEYMASLYNTLFEETKKMPDYLKEGFEIGVNIQKPTIKNPTPKFEIVDEYEITYGLAMIKGLGMETANHIWGIHNKKPFESFNDFIRRVDKNIVTKDVVEALIYAGVFDDFGNRKEIKELYKEISNKYKNYNGLVLLEEFSGMESEYDDHEKLNNQEEFEEEEKEKLEKTYAYHVFKINDAPKVIKKIKNVNEILSKNTKGIIFGKITKLNEAKDKNDNPMAFIELNVGSVIEKKITIFASQWKTLSEKTKEGQLVYVELMPQMKNVLKEMNYKLESNILKIQSDDNQFTDEMLKFLEKQNILEGFDEIRIVKDGSEKTFSVVMSKELLALIKKVTEGKARLIYDKVQL